VDENARTPASAAIPIASFAVFEVFERFCMDATSSCSIESSRSDYDFTCGHRTPWSMPTPALDEKTTPQTESFQ
jgi:hypothetical protein